MKVIAKYAFTDKKANRRRIKGEKFEITEKRLKEINNAGFGELVEEAKEKEVKKDESD